MLCWRAACRATDCCSAAIASSACTCVVTRMFTGLVLCGDWLSRPLTTHQTTTHLLHDVEDVVQGTVDDRKILRRRLNQPLVLNEVHRLLVLIHADDTLLLSDQ